MRSIKMNAFSDSVNLQGVGIKKIYSDPAKRPIQGARKCENILLFEAGGEPKIIDLNLLQPFGDGD